MQFSESWLRSLCNPPLSTEGLCHVLTMAGLEVEELEPAAPPFSGVVVAQVCTVDKHPAADKLKLCTVDVGGRILQIVCGAPNVVAGIKVPCAESGAVLPAPTGGVALEIKDAKVRGVESFGMLCSARELGVAEDQGGLLVLPENAPVGVDLRAYLDLDDHLITLKLTPNRADCLSLQGVARELSALTGAPLTAPAIESAAPTLTDTRTIVLEAPDACPRYCGRVLRDLNAKAATPEWMKRRIERSGVRSISALVDIANYVMLELGQPLHTFDDAKLTGAIRVRYPRSVDGQVEKIRLLNEQEVQLAADTALIADDRDVLAIAGIMGGDESGVTVDTRDVFLESAFFAPRAISGKARALGFSSDASHRYERGVDFDLPQRAIERATQLMLQICGGAAGPVVEALDRTQLPTRPAVRLRIERIERVLGMRLDATRVESLLKGLGLSVERMTTSGGAEFRVTPPSFRFDIEYEEDLIEELARIVGYDAIPSVPPLARLAMMPASEHSRSPMTLRRSVAERDYREVVSYSFVDAAWEHDFSGNTRPVALVNPIASQMGVMRSSLIGGLVGVLTTNRKRQVERVRIFEVGRCFAYSDTGLPVKGFTQPLRIAALAAGPALAEQWGSPARRIDFYDVKGDVEALLAPTGGVLEFAATQHPAFHPGRCARVSLDGQAIGVLGELHPRWLQKYELGTAPVLFELELPALLRTALPHYVEVSRFPTVIRDLALVVPLRQEVAPLLNALRAAAPAVVRDIVLFDIYQGKALEGDKKSLAFRVAMQDAHSTLDDARIEAVVASLLAVASRDFNAILRG